MNKDKAVGSAAPPPSGEVIYRHGRLVRITHWVNAVALALLLLSGLQIFNAYPRLHFGAYGADADPAWLEITTVGPSGPGARGVARLFGHGLDTTGVLGLSRGSGGGLEARAFPAWLTMPAMRDLAGGRRWHFFFAWLFVINGLLYLASAVVTGHLRRDLAPSRAELRPRNLAADVWDHLRLRHPRGEAAKRYNPLQKLAYLTVIFLILPAMVLTGLAMSPGVDAALPWLVDLLGGRPTARSIHFISANLIILFAVVHIVEVLLAGVVNEVGSMITGRYTVPAANGSGQ